MEYQDFFDMLNSLVGLRNVKIKRPHLKSLDQDIHILGRSLSIIKVEFESFTFPHVSYSRFFGDVINCFPHLQSLRFNKIPVGGEELTSMLQAGFEKGFEKRAGLKYLILDSCNLNAANFPLILDLFPNLEVLSIEGNKIGEGYLSNFEMMGLKIINAEETSMTDPGIINLISHCPWLTKITGGYNFHELKYEFTNVEALEDYFNGKRKVLQPLVL